MKPSCYDKNKYRHISFFSCTLQILLFFFRNKRFVAILLEAILSVPFFSTAFAHFLFLCHISVILAIFQFFHNYYICYDDLWSVVFGINIIIIWGHHKLCSYKMEILLYKYSVCFDCSSPFSGLLILWDIAVLKLSQLITLQWPLSFQVKGRVTHFSF